MRNLTLFTLVAWGLGAQTVPFRTYVADLDATSVTLAWGRADGGAQNTIGKGAAGKGEARIEIDGRVLRSRNSWLRVDGLRPDTEYTYSVTMEGAEVNLAAIRTWPEKAARLTFFVIGDFGHGTAAQFAVAARMEEERKRLERSNRHVRFVLTTGDNIYGKLSASGAKDRDWERKYFAPYADTLRAIPFKAVIGNHDGNESERAADLATCMDNFFMPDRWYRFTFASLVEVFLLDTTTNQAQGAPAPVYLAGGEQSKWLQTQLAAPAMPWRLAVMHHPMFTAGPNHPPFLPKAGHWMEALRGAGVQAIFSGHEHNFQYSERNEATGNMQFIVTGGGGEVRKQSVRKKMAERQIAAWSNQVHFLVVHIEGKEMTVEPIGIAPMKVIAADGNSATKPMKILSNR